MPDNVESKQPTINPEPKPAANKGMISEGGGNDLESSMKDNQKNDSIKFSGGAAGMKLDKRIFVHEDLGESKSDDKKKKLIMWI